MKIAVEGCAHGELEAIYGTIKEIEIKENLNIDLLICCGDFQAARNLDDLKTMAVPHKFLDMCTFYKYYSGELRAPILTLFIGGNHEASNHLQELPYGGWVAPNIYYLGYAGVVRINGIRIAGMSGIFKSNDFFSGRYEYPPYTESTRRSIYHTRQLDVFRLKQISGVIDIFISHDWPRGIYNYGDKEQLLRFKPHFREDIERDQLGSRPAEEILFLLKPIYWFSAHMHCKFAAIVPHSNIGDDKNDEKHPRVTKFLALDKCLPKKRFLQLIDIVTPEEVNASKLNFEYDIEWLTILHITNHLVSVKDKKYYMPGPYDIVNNDRYYFTPSEKELNFIRDIFKDLTIPENFCTTVIPYDPINQPKRLGKEPKAQINPQTVFFCEKLGIDDPLCIAMLEKGLKPEVPIIIKPTNEVDKGDALIQRGPCKRKHDLQFYLPHPSTKCTDSNDVLLYEKTIFNQQELQLDYESEEESDGSKIKVVASTMQVCKSINSSKSGERFEVVGTDGFIKRFEYFDTTKTIDAKENENLDILGATTATDSHFNKPQAKQFMRRNENLRTGNDPRTDEFEA